MSNILIITRNFPPLVGGMERLTLRTATALARRHKVYVCGPQGGASYNAGLVGYTDLPAKPIWKFLLKAHISAVTEALRFRPELIYAASGLTAAAAIVAAKLTGTPAACYLHGLDLVVDQSLYRSLFLPCIRACDRILVNSNNTKNLALARGIQETRITVLTPGVELPDLEDAARRGSAFLERHGLGQRAILLSVGRLTPRKGLPAFISKSLPRIVAQRPDVMLLVVGSAPQQAAKRESTDVLAEIASATRQARMSDHVRLLGSISDAELSDAYFASQILVFPIVERPGDVEGFGMVALEAAAHGLPTLAFRAGGVSDAVAADESGWLISPENYQGMADQALSYLTCGDTHALRAACRNFAQRHSWDNYAERLESWINHALKPSVRAR